MGGWRSTVGDALASSRHRAWARTARAGLAVLALVGGLGVLAIPPAEASVETESERIGVVLSGRWEGHSMGRVFFGSYTKDGSADPWFCAEFGQPIVSKELGSVEIRGGENYSRVAYLLGRYGGAEAPDVHAALAAAVHDLVDEGSMWGGWRASILAGVSEQYPQVPGLVDSMLAESATHAGPWRFVDMPALSFSDDAAAAAFSGVGVVSASGVQQSVPVELRLEGPAVWESSGTETLTVESGAPGPFEILVEAGASGEIGVVATANAPASVVRHSVVDGSQGHVALSAVSEPITAVVRSAIPDVSFQPMATTQAVERVDRGGGLVDRVHVVSMDGKWATSNGAPVPAVFRVDWYRFDEPQPENSSVPEVEPYTSQSLSSPGPGEYVVVAPRAADSSGYYYPVVSFHLDDQPEEQRRFFRGDWSANLHETAEETLAPWRPTVMTRAVSSSEGDSTLLRDTVTVEGNAPGRELIVETTLFGPFDERPEAWPNPDPRSGELVVPDGAPEVAVVRVAIVGDGEATTEPVRVSDSGYYVWVERIAATDDTEAWAGDFGVTDETSLVPWRPTVATRVSEALVAPGTVVTDVIEVSGVLGRHELTVESTLWGPFETDPSLLAVGDVPAGAPAVGTVSTLVAGNGTSVTEGLTVSEPGYYVWTESIAATAETAPWSGLFGHASETFRVESAPSLAATGWSGALPLAAAGVGGVGLGVGMISWMLTRGAGRSTMGI